MLLGRYCFANDYQNVKLIRLGQSETPLEANFFEGYSMGIFTKTKKAEWTERARGAEKLTHLDKGDILIKTCDINFSPVDHGRAAELSLLTNFHTFYWFITPS